MKKNSLPWILIVLLIFTIYFVNRNRLIQIQSIAKLKLDYGDSIRERESKIKELHLNIDQILTENEELRWKINDPKFISKRYADFKLNSLMNSGYSGPYKVDYIDGSLKIVGQLIDGKERGTWIYYFGNGTIEKYQWELVRVGATCCDGTSSNATGRGACSWHGGVCTWLYDYIRIKKE
jgi:hypothetical protein